MMVAALVDLVEVTVAKGGTSALTLGAAANALRGVEALTNGVIYNYFFQSDSLMEYGRGTYLAAGTQLTRAPLYSSNGGEPVNIPSGAVIAIGMAGAAELDSVTISAAAVTAAATATIQAGLAISASANAAASAVLATAQAASALVSQQAATAAAAIRGILTTPLTAGSSPPFEVSGITLTAAGTGGAANGGPYALGISGGPSGASGTYRVSSAGGVDPASITLDTRGLSTASTAPTISFPLGGVAGAMATATVSVIAAGRSFYAPSADGFALLAWTNSAGVVAPYGSPQIYVPTNLFDTSTTRYAYGKIVAGGQVDASGRISWVVTTDGFFYTKPAIRVGSAANGLTWSQTADGFWNIQLGSVAGQLPIGSGGDIIDSTSQRYVGGSPVLWGVADGSGNVGAALTADGYLRTKLPIVLGNTNGLTFSRAGNGLYTLGFGTVAGQMPISSGGDVIDSTSQRYYRGLTVTWGVSDASGGAAVAGTGDGSVVIPKLLSPDGLPKAHDNANWFFDVARVNGAWQIFQTSKATGVRTQLTSTGNNVNPAVDASGQKVIYSTDRYGLTTPTLVYQPLGGGTEWLAFPPPGIIDCWGDSLTAGAGASGTGAGQGPYPLQLAAVLGRTVNNYGIGGQNSPQIAGRQGGNPCLCTVTGNQVPASGAVTLTTYSADLGYNSGTSGNISLQGTLAGVHGTLAGNSVPGTGTATYTFTRDSAGSAVACPAATPFIPDLGVAARNHIQIIEVGRNNGTGAGQQAQILSDIAAMVGYQTAIVKRFLIMPVLNSVSERSGTSTYTAIMAINAAIQAAYPNNFVDTRSPPTTAEMAALGYSPTTQDLTDIANDTIPTGMRYQGDGINLHLVNSGYALQTRRLNAAFVARGW